MNAYIMKYSNSESVSVSTTNMDSEPFVPGLGKSGLVSFDQLSLCFGFCYLRLEFFVHWNEAWQFNKIKGTGAAGALTAHGQGKSTALHAKGHELEAVVSLIQCNG